MRISRAATPAALVLVAAIAAVIALTSGGGSTGTATGSSRHHGKTTSTGAATKPHSKYVRNATPQPGWTAHTGPVPILVYHILGEPPAGAPYPGLFVSDDEFRAEMEWLHTQGYEAVTLDEVMKAWLHGGTLPSKPIVITFDDGSVPQVTFAPSVMSPYGWPGVLNEVTTGHLSNARIRKILSIGWQVASHTVTHLDLTTLSPGELRHQLVDSRSFLRRTFHIPVDSFCYPASRYNATVIAAVKAAGYTNATTENPGYATKTDPYVLSRFEVQRGLGASGLAADLARH